MAADIFTNAFHNYSIWRVLLDLIGITVIDGAQGVEVGNDGHMSKKGKIKGRTGRIASWRVWIVSGLRVSLLLSRVVWVAMCVGSVWMEVMIWMR